MPLGGPGPARNAAQLGMWAAPGGSVDVVIRPVRQVSPPTLKFGSSTTAPANVSSTRFVPPVWARAAGEQKSGSPHAAAPIPSRAPRPGADDAPTLDPQVPHHTDEEPEGIRRHAALVAASLCRDLPLNEAPPQTAAHRAHDQP